MNIRQKWEYIKRHKAITTVVLLFALFAGYQVYTRISYSIKYASVQLEPEVAKEPDYEIRRKLLEDYKVKRGRNPKSMAITISYLRAPIYNNGCDHDEAVPVYLYAAQYSYKKGDIANTIDCLPRVAGIIGHQKGFSKWIYDIFGIRFGFWEDDSDQTLDCAVDMLIKIAANSDNTYGKEAIIALSSFAGHIATRQWAIDRLVKLPIELKKRGEYIYLMRKIRKSIKEI